MSTNVDDELFLEQLVPLAIKRGLTKTKSKLEDFIKKAYKVQLANEVSRFSIFSLQESSKVSCYYFRNANGAFLGEMKSYYTVDSYVFPITDSQHAWKEWQAEFHNFFLMDLETSNHFTLLVEPQSCKTIVKFCASLYSKNGLSKEWKTRVKGSGGKNMEEYLLIVTYFFVIENLGRR